MGLLDKLKKTKQADADEKKSGRVRSVKKKVKEETKEKDAETPLSETAQTASAGAGSRAFRVLLQPLLSEKAATLESRGTYTFVVSKDANKYQVKQAIKDVYGVMPTRVRMINVQGKFVRFSRGYGRRGDWKKAIVTLPEGKTISIHEGV